MTGRTIARLLLAIILIGGALTLGIGAYNAGVTAGLAQTGQVVVANGPYLAPAGAYVGYGWGWGHGFGFFGFLGGLLFLFLLIGLIRAAFGGPRRGWGPGYGSRHGWGYGGWEGRAREAHDAWHREHPDRPDSPDETSRSGA